MYIALKWLTGLSLLMWMLMCCVDEHLQNNIRNSKGNNVMKLGYTFENITLPRKHIGHKLRYKYILKGRNEWNNGNTSQYVMLISCASLMYLFVKKDLLFQTREYVSEVELCNKIYIVLNKIKNVDYAKLLDFIYKNVVTTWAYLKCFNSRCIDLMLSAESNIIEEHEIESAALIQKLKEVNEDRKNLSQLLVSAIEENKNTKMKLQLENMAKDRLSKHLEDLNKQMKENRMKYFNFQHLHLVTHQENIFLKARMKKVTRDKNEALQNFMDLLKKVYQSKNSELREYCSRFIVCTKDNLLNSDVKEEINNFIQTSKSPEIRHSNWIKKDSCVARKKPLLAELTNEIESLEMDMKTKQSLSENGDCYNYTKSEWDLENVSMVKLSHVKQVMNDPPQFNVEAVDAEKEKIEVAKLDYPTYQKFLTSSKAFKNFLRNNPNNITSSV